MVAFIQFYFSHVREDDQETIKNNRIQFLATLNNLNSSKTIKVVSSDTLNFDLVNENEKTQIKQQKAPTRNETKRLKTH